MFEQASVLQKRIMGRTMLTQYLVFLPDGYETENDSWPVMVFLHGAGERGDNLERVKEHGPPQLAAAGVSFPFVLVAPQCPRGESWASYWLSALLDEACEHYRVDPDRIYLTGLSMGGYGVWDWAIEEPQRFAAIAPICGGGDPASVCRIKDLPVWAFHGANDNVVPLGESQIMVDALAECGGDVKFTVYPDAGHDSWTETYNNPELYDWFLEHRRAEKVAGTRS